VDGTVLDIYARVLSHTIEIGNGWGTRGPSPLKGFYVLDHAVLGIESGHVTEGMLAAEAVPFDRDLQQAVLTAVTASAPIEWIPRFYQYVEMELPGPVHVRNSYGIVVLGPVVAEADAWVVGVFFYAGGRWSRTNRYELAMQEDAWAITRFETLDVS